MKEENILDELEELKIRFIEDPGNKEVNNRIGEIRNLLDKRYNSTCHTRAIETPKTPKIDRIG